MYFDNMLDMNYNIQCELYFEQSRRVATSRVPFACRRNLFQSTAFKGAGSEFYYNNKKQVNNLRDGVRLNLLL